MPGYRSPILALRKRFDLYANLRPTNSLLPDGPQLDFLIVRENTRGCMRAGTHAEGADIAIGERIITRHASERIARVAFEQARRRSSVVGRRSSVTVVHKANVLKLTDGLFRQACSDGCEGVSGRGG